MTDKKKFIPILITSALSVLMVAVSRITGETDIIFPEAAAVAIGVLAAPVRSWNTSKLRLMLTITAAALLGMAVVRFVPFPIYIKMPIGLAAVTILITLSQTNFLPAISACILPIMNGTHSAAYPLSVVTVTGITLLTLHIFEETGMRNKYRYVPIEPTRPLIRLRVAQVMIASIVCFIPLALERPFFIAPPLIVAFFEMTAPSSPVKKDMTTATVMMALSAFLGVSCRILLGEIAGLPMAAAAAVTTCAIMFAIEITGFYFPPCGSVGLLPYLIPQHTLVRFPFIVTTGFLIFAAISLVSSNHVKHEMEEAEKENSEHTEAYNHI